jgi:pimeloyl-ACP methyl ester carboxylesterase
LRALGLNRPAIVGHDWGGVIAFSVARSHPDVLSRLVAINAPLHKVDPLRSWYVFAFQVPGIPELVFRKSGDALLERAMINACRVKNAFTPADLKIYQEAFRSAGAHRAALAYYRALKREALPHNRRRFFSRINVPTLVIWSEEDPILPPYLTDGMHRIIPHLRLEFVPDAGHFLPEEQPEAVNRLLLDWLGERGRENEPAGK